jgi:hypothetical protein
LWKLSKARLGLIMLILHRYFGGQPNMSGVPTQISRMRMVAGVGFKFAGILVQETATCLYSKMVQAIGG